VGWLNWGKVKVRKWGARQISGKENLKTGGEGGRYFKARAFGRLGKENSSTLGKRPKTKMTNKKRVVDRGRRGGASLGKIWRKTRFQKKLGLGKKRRTKLGGRRGEKYAPNEMPLKGEGRKHFSRGPRKGGRRTTPRERKATYQYNRKGVKSKWGGGKKPRGEPSFKLQGGASKKESRKGLKSENTHPRKIREKGV